MIFFFTTKINNHKNFVQLDDDEVQTILKLESISKLSGSNSSLTSISSSTSTASSTTTPTPTPPPTEILNTELMSSSTDNSSKINNHNKDYGSFNAVLNRSNDKAMEVDHKQKGNLNNTDNSSPSESTSR